MKDEKQVNNLIEIILQWNHYKDVDLSSFLLNDKQNETHLTNEELKEFMSSYEDLALLIINHSNIYLFIKDFLKLSKEEKDKRIKKLADDMILYQENEITNEEIKVLSKYINVLDYLKIVDYEEAEKLINELKELPDNYLYDSPIPFHQLLSFSVLKFLSTYGIKNVVEFDQECGNFFTKNNCDMLKEMYNLYLRYESNKYDKDKTFYTKDPSLDRPYTKDEFYEAIKRMIIQGPTNLLCLDKAPDYREMTGEFRRRNQELFLSEDAPEELKEIFYKKEITPELLINNPNYIPYLKNKKLSSCMKDRTICVEEGNNLFKKTNLYDYLLEKTNYDETIKYITEYSSILNSLFNKNNNIYIDEKDDFKTIQEKIDYYYIRLLITKRIPYSKNIPNSFIEQHKTLFLNPNASKEIKEAFYNRTISIDDILSHKEDIIYLKDINLELLFPYIPVNNGKDNLINIIKETFKEEALDILLQYEKYIELMYKTNKQITINSNTKEELLNELDKEIFNAIVNGQIKYQEDIPSHFKKNYPTLFIDGNEELKEKFYNRKITINNIQEIDLEKTNIIAGMNEEYSWLIPLFSNLESALQANYNRLKVLIEFKKIEDQELEELLKEFINNQDLNKILEAINVLIRISHSKSKEIHTLKEPLAKQILNSNNPIDKLNQIEDIFVNDYIPSVGKTYSCFEILHPNIEEFNNKALSPILQKSSSFEKKLIIFQDLIKASLGSNNKTLKEYLETIEKGTTLYKEIKSQERSYEELTNQEKEELKTFSKYLNTLYNKTEKGKKEENKLTGNTILDINELVLKLSPNKEDNYKLEDRIINMFCGITGIKTLKQAKEYMQYKVEEAEERNRKAGRQKLELSLGDYIKGIGDITYLPNILQNGCISNDYIKSSTFSDSTPLDVDLGKIITSYGSTKDKINYSSARAYGPIWIVLKNDDRFYETNSNENKRDLSKLEVFKTGITGRDHYGIRTGFASTEINYIIVEEYDYNIGLEIVENGFYIPVADKEGNIIFTPEDYDKLKEQINLKEQEEHHSYK